VQQGVAPQHGNVLKCSWLYAGNPEHPAVLAHQVGSENPTGAGNQQERPAIEA
jgi:hypothetical protein